MLTSEAMTHRDPWVFVGWDCTLPLWFEVSLCLEGILPVWEQVLILLGLSQRVGSLLVDFS